jgi:hypothetical protein
MSDTKHSRPHKLKSQMYLTDVDVAAEPNEAVAMIRTLIPAGKRRWVKLINPSGPAGGCPIVRVKLFENEMRRFLCKFYSQDAYNESDPWIRTLTYPPLPEYKTQ